MPNYGYHLARVRGGLVHSIYNFFLPRIAGRKVDCNRNIPIDVFSYSGRHRLAEQVASIRSFLKYAGRPNRFVVVSDGTHLLQDVQLLRQIDPCVSVEPVPPPGADVPEVMNSYLRNHPTGKQLSLLMTLPRENPVFYVDSDVLFFSGAADLSQNFENLSAPAYYLEDCGFAGDDRLLHGDDEKAGPVNIGALLFLRPLDWSLGISRYAEIRGDPNFFTGQTITHLVMHANGAQPLDRSNYVVELDDQFVYPDRHAGPDIILRHYVNPVRHKLWASLNR